MKIAIPVEEDKESVCTVFGRAPYFALYDTESKGLSCAPNPAASAQGGAGIKAAQFAVDLGADALITQRLGENAAEVLKAAGLTIYKSENANVEADVAALLNGSLKALTRFHAGFHGLS